MTEFLFWLHYPFKHLDSFKITIEWIIWAILGYATAKLRVCGCMYVCDHLCTLGLKANRGLGPSVGLTEPRALWCQCRRHLEASHTYTWGPVATRATCHLATPAGQWHLSSLPLQSHPAYPRLSPMACCHTPVSSYDNLMSCCQRWCQAVAGQYSMS